MDLLAEIRKRATALGPSATRDGVAAVVQHIEIAEHHLSVARRDTRDEYFNDVIYRTNQAYEGILREAYSLLAVRNSQGLSTHAIEQFLLKRGILAQRAVDLLKNYRQNWRNPSTHDHRLAFRDHEAVLAIVAVSSFAVVLLEQMIGAASYAEAEKEGKKPMPLAPAAQRLPLADRVAQLVRQFVSGHAASTAIREPFFESQLLGQLNAFLSAAEPSITVRTEASIAGKSAIRADMLVEEDGDIVLLELKRRLGNAKAADSAVRQVMYYLQKAGLSTGVLFSPPWDGRDDLTIGDLTRELDGNEYRVLIIGAGDWSSLSDSDGPRPNRGS